MERDLARHIEGASDLRYLGIKGLGFTRDIIDTALKDSPDDVTKAARLVIRKWSSKYTDKEQAYRVLLERMRGIGETHWINALVKD